MSYCRFSSSGEGCDVYCYEHYAGGFMVHVAANRHISDHPKPRPMEIAATKSAGDFLANYHEWQAWFKTARIVPIGLPHDGEDYCEATAGDAADRLEELRRAGYIVPQYAIDALREEGNGD